MKSLFKALMLLYSGIIKLEQVGSHMEFTVGHLFYSNINTSLNCEVFL